MNIQVTDNSGYHLLGFAKKKLRELGQLRLSLDLCVLNKSIAVGEFTIFIEAAQWGDRLRISGADVHELSLVINGHTCEGKNFCEMWNPLDGESPHILYGSKRGVGYPVYTEKTIVFRHPDYADVIVRVDPFGKMPTFQKDGVFYKIRGINQVDEKIHKDAVPYLFCFIDFCAGAFWWCENSEPCDFVTLSDDFTSTPWEFYVGGSVVGNKFGTPKGANYVCFDRKKKLLHFKSTDQVVAANFDVLRNIDPYYSPNGEITEYVLSEYALPGGISTAHRRLRVKVSGTGTFKLWFYGRYKHPYLGWKDKYDNWYKFFYDENPGCAGAVINRSKEYTIHGEEWIELAIPPAVVFIDTENKVSLIPSYNSTINGRYHPVTVNFRYGVESIDGKECDVVFSLFNVLTDHYKTHLEFDGMEFELSSSATSDLEVKGASLFDVYKAYTWDEFIVAHPEIRSYAYKQSLQHKLHRYSIVHHSFLRHREAYSCIQASVRNDPEFAEGHMLGPPGGPIIYPEGFRFIDRVFLLSTDNRTLGEILTSRKSSSAYAIRLDNLRVNAYVYANYPARNEIATKIYSYPGAPETLGLYFSGYSVNPSKEPDYSFLGRGSGSYAGYYYELIWGSEGFWFPYADNQNYTNYPVNKSQEPYKYELIDSSYWEHWVTIDEPDLISSVPITTISDGVIHNEISIFRRKIVKLRSKLFLFAEKLSSEEAASWEPAEGQYSIGCDQLYLSYNGPPVYNFWGYYDKFEGEVIKTQWDIHIVRGGALTPLYNI